jgi:NifB/MoaA-like Fe-S oxidoreductase
MRRLLLGNDRAPDIRPQLERLFSIGIRVHTQVVTCPGLNDGAYLEQTVRDLADYSPDVLSIGVVPVGLTRTPQEILAGPGASCSRILPSAADLPLRTFEPEEAREVVRQTRRWQRAYRARFGCSLVYASDEFYLLAKEPVPSAESYDCYPQYENGIGMVRDLIDDWKRLRRRLRSRGFGDAPAPRDTRGGAAPRGWPRGRPDGATAGTLRVTSDIRYKSATLVCAEMIGDELSRLVGEWRRVSGVCAEVTVLKNGFFGPRVRVSGLLTGGDVIANRDRYAGDVVILPMVMLDKTGTRTLDGMTPAEIAAGVGKPVRFAGYLSEADRIIREPLRIPA